MNERRKLKRQLGSRYRFKRYMTAGEAKVILNSKPKDNRERLYAALTVGCVKISAVLFPTPNGMTFGCDILVKDKPDSKEWICYDSIGEPFRYTALNLEQELFDILDKEVKAQGLSYTECNFEKLTGKTVSKTEAAL